MSGPVQVALLGCGRIARAIHLPVLADLRGATLTAVVDPDPSGLEAATAVAPQAKPFDTLEAMIDAGVADAVVIATPTHLHAAGATAALRAGLHVYIEKPLAANLDDGQAIVNAWEQSNRCAMMGFNYRFEPAYLALKTALENGQIGTPVGVRTQFTAATRELPAWKRQPDTGGSALLDLASHHVDMLNFLFGETLQDAKAVIHDAATPGDTAALVGKLTGGLPVSIFTSLAAIEQDVFEVIGDRGKLTVQWQQSREPQFTPIRPGYGRADRVREAGGFAAQALARLGRAWRPSPMTLSWRSAFETFIQCVSQGEQAPVTPIDGLDCLQTILAAQKSGMDEPATHSTSPEARPAEASPTEAAA